MLEVVNSVLPVVVMLLIGSLCREKKLISENGVEGLQALVMNFCLPASLFCTFYKTSIGLSEAVLPAAFFIVTFGGIFAGMLLGKLFKISDRRLPFFLTGYEAGMLGYALVAILIGDITTFGIMDVGHCLAIFTVYLAMLKGVNGEKQTTAQVIKGILTTPVLVAILAGAILGMTGIGGKIAASPAGSVVDTLCDFISAPTAAAILAVIGYRMKFAGLDWSKTLKICGIRALEQAVFGVLVMALFHALGGKFSSGTVIVSAAVMLTLPPPFILPLYTDDAESREFYSSAISLFTVITIVCFAVLTALKSAGMF